METPERIVVIGAGQAGGWAAKTLRGEGFEGRLDLVGAEDSLPYERPPLSKAVLIGEADNDSTLVFDTGTFDSLNVEWHRGVCATSIDRESRTVSLDRGESLAYDRLVIATGSRVRRLNLPGADHPRVRYLRDLDDSAAIRAQLSAGRHLAVIGGGWIGLEVAASARKRGLNVTVLEAGERLCARALPPELSDFLASQHRAHDVDVRLGVGIESFRDTGDGAVEVVMGDGEPLVADLVVVGIGVAPDTALAEAAGLEVDNGVVTDAVGRTSDPLVFACGDVTAHQNAFLDRRVRLESWANAQNQAIAAARAALGLESTYDDVPWFWSDQYDMNIQMLGVPERWTEPVMRGDPGEGTFTAFYLAGDRLDAVVAVNNARDIKVARRLMERRIPVDASKLADTDVKLQALLKG